MTDEYAAVKKRKLVLKGEKPKYAIYDLKQFSRRIKH